MSASATLSAMLLTMAEERNTPLAALVTGYNVALRAVRASDDLEARMAAVAELHLAAEAAEAGFAEAKVASRATLTTAFHESGCPGLYLAHHHVTPTEGARRVIVTDAAALAATRPGLMVHPPPKPDTTAIGRLLRAGEAVEGCTLSNGSEPGIRFGTIKKG